MTLDPAPNTTVPEPQRHVFPPPMERNYRIEGGRIQTRSLEAHIVDHCNLTCAECCSLSPLLPEWYAEPAPIEADLRRAATVLQPRVFKLVGGEPLLHPALVEIIERVRATGIAPVTSLTTNGLKLGDMPDAFWQAVDALTISRYPKPRLTPDLVAHIERQAARFGVRLNWKVQDTFTLMDRAQALADRDEAQRVFHDCWIRERCHMIRDGMFYTCTRPAHFHTLFNGEKDFQSDGLPLRDEAGLLDAMLAYLSRETPLEACLHCHGGSAPVRAHRILKRAEVAALQARYR
ncbi:GTP 3',8-cyclase MoaA family protein [Chitinasiproducens palmae]|uniref:4Fe-4S single cluster domain-containing protein n=1 Tax=Chitinasiproducens palmae TaxID=1770053 RepID=A0A1H2PKU4_9BURK|nr:4Fe-4S cluster-binding domain-containing protein [Chitinasiproducens palmae]SDV47056.1 4Fe-4S single cluster domain-containing protein [Chitinasiproducens palmae]